MYYGYVDFTDDGRPYYVGIGDRRRLRKLKWRNTKHKGISRNRGQLREVWYRSRDWTACKWWERIVINALETHHYDNPEGIGCNFTRGGDGTLGWKPSDVTRALWSAQRKGKPGVKGPRPNTRGRRRPWVTKALKGRKRPDLSAIMSGKKRGPYDVPEQSRWKQGATNRGKRLRPEHREKIRVSCLGYKPTEETLQKLRKPRTPEQRERYKQAALKRWERQRSEKQPA